MKQFLKKAMRPAIFTFAGAVTGYVYYYFIGCTQGSCAIASRPLRATLYVALIGFLLSYVFPKREKQKDDAQDDR